MSYRLIDSNALAQTYPEVNGMPCIYADLDCLDGQHYDLREPSTLQTENTMTRSKIMSETKSNSFDKSQITKIICMLLLAVTVGLAGYFGNQFYQSYREEQQAQHQRDMETYGMEHHSEYTDDIIRLTEMNNSSSEPDAGQN